jgi:hypothetical protein
VDEGCGLASRIDAELARRLPAAAAREFGGSLRGGPAQLRTLAPGVHHAIAQAVAADAVFAWALPFAALALLLTLLLRELPLRDSFDTLSGTEAPQVEPSAH